MALHAYHPVLRLLIKRAALGNLKTSFHCAHWHRFFPLKKEFFLPLRLSCKENSTSNQAFSIVFTTPSVPLVGDRNLRRKNVNRPTRCSEPLRSKVGGPSKVYAKLCGMGPRGDRLLLVFAMFCGMGPHGDGGHRQSNEAV